MTTAAPLRDCATQDLAQIYAKPKWREAPSDIDSTKSTKYILITLGVAILLVGWMWLLWHFFGKPRVPTQVGAIRSVRPQISTQ